MKHLGFIIVSALLVSTSAISQTETYGNYDTNRDGKLDETEFNSTNHSSEWFNDKSEMTQEDFYQKSFDKLNTDRNDNISSQEWANAAEKKSIYLNKQDFNTFDADNNGSISSKEYNDSMSKTGYFTNYDSNRDNKLDEDEVRSGMFKAYDRNRDGMVDANEFKRE